MAYLSAITRFSLFFASLLLLTGSSFSTPSVSEAEFRQAPSKKTANSLKRSSKTADLYYEQRLSSLGVALRPGTEHRQDSKSNKEASERCRSLVYKTLLKLPPGHRNQLKELTLFYTEDGRRGLGGSNSITLRCLNTEDSELASVFLHEMGHLVDATYLTGKSIATSGFSDFGTPVPADDPSVRFFQISWQNEFTKKAYATELDFVSGYAESDPFEDFAETYAYFRVHGAEFRKLAETSADLRKKYDFIKREVFGGKEFGDYKGNSDLNPWERFYDVTVLPYSLNLFLNQIDGTEAL